MNRCLVYIRGAQNQNPNEESYQIRDHLLGSTSDCKQLSDRQNPHLVRLRKSNLKNMKNHVLASWQSWRIYEQTHDSSRRKGGPGKRAHHEEQLSCTRTYFATKGRQISPFLSYDAEGQLVTKEHRKQHYACRSRCRMWSSGIENDVLLVRVTRVCRWNETSAQKIFITTIENPKQENPNVNPKLLKYQLP